MWLISNLQSRRKMCRSIVRQKMFLLVYVFLRILETGRPGGGEGSIENGQIWTGGGRGPKTSIYLDVLYG